MENNEEIKKEEVVDEKPVEGEVKEQPVVDDRPTINYQKELERKNKELEKTRQELETLRSNSAPRRDSNDLTTWPDHELKALKYSNDPGLAQFKAQAEDILVERKFNYLREKERMQEKRLNSEMELRSKYPEALDPSTEMGYRVEQVMQDFDLQKSPAGRLAAAKIVAAELGKGKASTDAEGRKRESERIADVKKQMTDRDRPKSVTGSSAQSKNEELSTNLSDSRNPAKQEKAIGEILQQRGITDRFKKKWNG